MRNYSAAPGVNYQTIAMWQGLRNGAILSGTKIFSFWYQIVAHMIENTMEFESNIPVPKIFVLETTAANISYVDM